MKKRVFQKVNNHRGFSLSEMLTTVVILSLVTLGAASGIAAAQRVYKNVRLKANAQTLCSTAINAIAEKLYYSKVYSTSDSLTNVSYSQAGICFEQTSTKPAGTTVYTDGSDNDVKIVDWIFTESDGYIRFANATPSGQAEDSQTESGVTIYPVVSDKTQALNLYAKLQGPLTYQDGCYTFTVLVGYDEGGTFTEVESQEAEIRTALVIP